MSSGATNPNRISSTLPVLARLEFFRASLGSRAFQARPEPETRALEFKLFRPFKPGEARKARGLFKLFELERSQFAIVLVMMGWLFRLPEAVDLMKLKSIIYNQSRTCDSRHASILGCSSPKKPEKPESFSGF